MEDIKDYTSKSEKNASQITAMDNDSTKAKCGNVNHNDYPRNYDELKEKRREDYEKENFNLDGFEEKENEDRIERIEEGNAIRERGLSHENDYNTSQKYLINKYNYNNPHMNVLNDVEPEVEVKKKIIFEDTFYLSYDRNFSVNTIIDSKVPLNYFKSNFYFEREYTFPNYKIYYSITYLFYKKYFNGLLKVSYQVNGNNFYQKSRYNFIKDIENYANELITPVPLTQETVDTPNPITCELIENDAQMEANPNDIENEETTGKNAEKAKATEISIEDTTIKCDFEEDCKNPTQELNKESDNEFRLLNENKNTFDDEDKKYEKLSDIKQIYVRFNDEEKLDLTEFLIKYNTPTLEEEHKLIIAKEEEEVERLKTLLGTFDSFQALTVVDKLQDIPKNLNYGKIYSFSKTYQFLSDILCKVDCLLIDHIKKEVGLFEKIEVLTHLNDMDYIYSKNQDYTAKVIFEASIMPKNNGKIHEANKIGLVNEAMTCYMNSMLQILNSINYFKKALFQVVVDEKTSCVYGLQRLFYELETSKEPVSTQSLIKSFGWSNQQIIEQHDIQEFNLKLSDSLENKLKGTSSEGLFKYLFEGKTENYIQCKYVDYCSKRQETITDIQLDVKGFSNIYESLKNYVREETLEGDNKYDAEKFGKQDAIRGVKFKQLPPVIIFQLKRFEYNFMSDTMEKVNDKFEFFEELSLNEFLTQDSLEVNSKSLKY